MGKQISLNIDDAVNQQNYIKTGFTYNLDCTIHEKY